MIELYIVLGIIALIIGLVVEIKIQGARIDAEKEARKSAELKATAALDVIHQSERADAYIEQSRAKQNQIHRAEQESIDHGDRSQFESDTF